MSAPSPTIPQEDDRIGARRIVLVAITSIVVILASIGVARWIGGATTRGLGREHIAHPTRTAPREIGIVDQTLIETEAYGELLRAQQRRVLAHYGWVDRRAGIARIPIERAMELVVEQEGAR